MAVNCGAIPKELMASELFGYEVELSQEQRQREKKENFF